MRVIKGVNAHALDDGSQHYSIKFDLGSHSGNENDIEILSDGGVTITPISTNWTCHETLKLWTQ
jgi:broad specificity polyphosphatase/5'/3'-nucleotidase SurE